MVAAGCCSASRRIWDTPSSAACAAADSPEGPEPMMAILNMEEWRLAGERLLYPGIGAASKPGVYSRYCRVREAHRCVRHHHHQPRRAPMKQARAIIKCETAHRRQ